MAIQSARCRVRGVLFCNPHNPRGQIYSSGVLEALVRFCEGRDLHFISDEVYAMTTFGGTGNSLSSLSMGGPAIERFTSVLHLDLEGLQVAPSRVHLLHSISKDLGSSGLRMVMKKTPSPSASTLSLTYSIGLHRHSIQSSASVRDGHSEPQQSLKYHITHWRATSRRLGADADYLVEELHSPPHFCLDSG